MAGRNKFHQMVGYQIYPKSFKDTDGDGIGDILGIIEKLPYLKDLGVDFLWINPIYQSPQVDGGYDVSDFYAIDPIFGTMPDFKALLKAAHQVGLKIIMDLVINHTSDRHPWFLESKKSKNNPYRDYYHWVDASPDQMPNNWQSFFGTSAWTYDEKSGQAYFHAFAPQQPDLNWNNPKVREEIYQMIRWWLELGIDGFRLDAISHIQKAPWNFKIKSWTGNGPWQPFMNVAGIEVYMRELKTLFEEYGALSVGEASGVTSDLAPDWTDPTEGSGGYVQMIFELEHNQRKKSQGYLYGYKKTIIRWQEAMRDRGWNALYLENHDNPRSIDVFGDGSLESAKALAVSYMLLRGTPFIYQGQEIGMSNFPFTDIRQVQAIEIKNYYQTLLDKSLSPQAALEEATRFSRDHARTPMQWDKSSQAGFTSGRPWMPVNPNYQVIHAENNDLLTLYQTLIRLRHRERDLTEGDIHFHFSNHLTAFVYERGRFLIFVNLGRRRAHLNLVDRLLDFETHVMGSITPPRPLEKKMVLGPWEYLIYQKSS